MQDRYIYEFTGYTMRVFKHKVLKETDKTFQIQKANWPYRLHKNNINVKEWDGGFYSFDMKEIIIAAFEGIEKLKKETEQKVAKCYEDIEALK